MREEGRGGGEGEEEEEEEIVIVEEGYRGERELVRREVKGYVEGGESW